jgi:hypothetical protein
LFIVGAQKAGTSALYSYLENHPQLLGGDEKEPGYFSRDAVFAKGHRHYRSLFRLGTHQYAYALDATPEYLYYRRCAERIHAFAPGAKIVALLREPVARAFSAFNMYLQGAMSETRRGLFRRRLKWANADARDFFTPIAKGQVEPDLTYFLEQERRIMDVHGMAEEPSLIRRGVYAGQLARYMELFGRENVLVIFSDQLHADTGNVVNRVLEFVGLEKLSASEFRRVHVGEYLVDDSEKRLIRHYAGDLYAKDKSDLATRYGIDVPW